MLPYQSILSCTFQQMVLMHHALQSCSRGAATRTYHVRIALRFCDAQTFMHAWGDGYRWERGSGGMAWPAGGWGRQSGLGEACSAEAGALG